MYKTNQKTKGWEIIRDETERMQNKGIGILAQREKEDNIE